MAIGAFLVGAFAGGKLGFAAGDHRGKFLARATSIELALMAAALAVYLAARNPDGELLRYALIVLLATAMGLQNAAARRLGVPDLTTTVLTLTLTGVAADSTLAGGKNPNPVCRLAAIASMFFGAAVGTLLLFHVGVSAVLALALALLALSAIAAFRLSSSTDAWTVPV